MKENELHVSTVALILVEEVLMLNCASLSPLHCYFHLTFSQR